jgi:hypothetical protein
MSPFPGQIDQGRGKTAAIGCREQIYAKKCHRMSKRGGEKTITNDDTGPLGCQGVVDK